MDRKDRLLELITTGLSALDEIDNMIETQSSELQSVDLELSDLYHLYENRGDLNKDQAYNIYKRIHELRVIRRILQEEHELELTYNANKSKLSGENTRQFLLAEIKKTQNRLGSEYKNRILTEEMINNLLEEKEVKRRGRPKKEENDDE